MILKNPLIIYDVSTDLEVIRPTIEGGYKIWIEVKP
jgi:hypothetical protein